MIKQTFLIIVAVAMFAVTGTANAQKKTVSNTAKKTITIKGTVKFNEPMFKMAVVKRDGFDKKIIGEFDINPDGTYKYEMEVTEPGQYTLDCKKWQSTEFWAENEDIEVDFRGKDTAKMVIKNPTYSHIKNAGPLNEVMNQMNYLAFRNQAFMIDLCQIAYRAKFANKEDNQKLQNDLLDPLQKDMKERLRFLATQYSDRTSVLSVLSSLNPVKDADVIDKTIARLESINPNYAPLLKYKAEKAEEKFQRERLAIGKPAPEFSFPTPEGKMLGIKDFKGKILVVDFWASWCGPCRLEIPHLKEVAEKYKGKGVELFSVSIDKKDADWRKALAEEGMTWSQVCAPNAGKEIMKEYQFSGIPYIILIDQDGKIIAKNLRGNQVDAAIDAALAKKK